MNTPVVKYEEVCNLDISVIIPTCGRNELLSKCLDCLSPTTQLLESSKYEVIVSDDGHSTTAETMVREKYPWVKWVAGPRKGPAANRNNGATQAVGKWLAFTDDDCLPEPGWLLAFFQKISAKTSVLEGKTATEPSKGSFYVAPENLTGGHLWSCNMMITQSLFDKMNGFDDNFTYPHLEDVDLHLRLKKEGNIIDFVPEAIVFHPRRPLGSVIRQAYYQESIWYISRKHGILLKDLGMHPFYYWKNQMRQIFKYSKSLKEGLRFFITRSCVEAFLLFFLSFKWNRKYNRQDRGV